MSGRRSIPRSVLAVVLAVIVLAGGWGLGFVAFAVNTARGVADPDSVTDAVVVLTGGSERLARGLELLEQGKGRKLFVSGVHKGVDLPDLLRQARPDRATLPQGGIVLGHSADDTIGNAAETAQWMAAEGFTSLRLVTAAYHMRRASLEFRRAMPQVAIIAHPVFPDAFKMDQWWRWPGTAHLLATEYTKYLGALARPLFIPKSAERKS